MNNFWKTFIAALLGTIAALVLDFIFVIAIITALSVVAGTEEVPRVAKNSILKIDLSGTIGERTTDGMENISIASLVTGSGKQSSLGIYDAIRGIEKAAEDPAIKFILINNSLSVGSGITAIEELRSSLEKFHSSGKPIIAYGLNYSQGGYYVSSVADKIYMHPDGMALITGMGSQMLFLKDFLDKLGVEVQLIRHGKFKAAGEPFIRNNISNENRAQNMEMLNSFWETLSCAICESRGIERETLDEAINTLQIGDGESMIKYHLADSLLSSKEFTKRLCELSEVEDEKDLNYISLTDYCKTLSQSSSSKNKIAILYAEGQITMSGTSGISAQQLIPEIRKISADSSIKAVVFRVNSPGGDAQASEMIREELQALRANKPIISSYGEYAASGGYWISAQSDKIVSDATTLTGSIGVYSMAFNIGRGLKKHLGVNSASLGTHAHSTMGVMIDPLTEEEIEYQEKFIEHIYGEFTSLVADGRNLSVAEVDSIGQGRVWTGEQGVKVGIVDYVGGIEDAINCAAEIAGLENYKIEEYPRIKTSMEVIMEMLSGKSNDNTVNGSMVSTPEDIVKLLFPDSYYDQTIRTYAQMPYIPILKY